MLTHLNIHQLRNIQNANLVLHPRYNIFYGMNGSGKTSVLEAIYLLGTGLSFRSRETAPLVKQGEEALTIFARLNREDSISIQKSHRGSTQVKLNQQPCHRSSELAHFLPCQLIYQDIFQIIDAGPAIRRSVLDWGLFHVKQSYHALWKEYRHVLKQRNALLRQQTNPSHYIPWDKLLTESGEELNRLRAEHFKTWAQVFQFFLAQLTDIPCSIHYYKGWDKKSSGLSLASVLKEQFDADRQRQYTHAGPHQADILFDSVTLKAKQNLSRGQQKMILIALKLAQSHLLAKPCIYLFDDITVELDTKHIERFLKCISEVPGQFFLTSTVETTYKELGETRIFELEEGRSTSTVSI